MSQRRNNGEGRIPPHNLPAEESLLGALLLSGAARDEALPLVTARDYYKPAHQHVHTAILELHRQAKGVDVITVGEALRVAGLLDEVGGTEFLLGLVNATPAISNATRYAETVSNTSQQRNLIAAASALLDAAYEEKPVDESIAETKAKLDEIDMAGRTGVSIIGGADFLGAPPEPHDWVMDYVLERDDRLMVTGGEGAKKSMLLLQLAVMASAGVHWWEQCAVKPRRALMIDMEIGAKRTRRRIELFAEEADWLHESWTSNLAVYSKPGDIDITTRAGISYLASMFETAFPDGYPDIAFIGPVYRLMSGTAKPGDIGGEDQAKRAAFALDTIRERFNCALVLETHAAKGDSGRSRDMRPFGSSVWTRWPEFGYALVRQADDAPGFSKENRAWINWRGDRDPREWPDYFEWCNKGWRMQAQFDTPPSWRQALRRGDDLSKRTGPVVHPDNLDQF